MGGDAAAGGDAASFGASAPFASLEVAPTLAHDTDGTIAAAERLWARVDRPNAMIKIPGTQAGLGAITSCIAEAINVNVTLLFSLERYAEVVAPIDNSPAAEAGVRSGDRSSQRTGKKADPIPGPSSSTATARPATDRFF